MWSTPIEIALALVSLWQLVGPCTLVPIALLVLVVMPVASLVATRVSALEAKCSSRKDERVKVVTELLSNIKPVKMYGWEDTFRAAVRAARGKEWCNSTVP